MVRRLRHYGEYILVRGFVALAWFVPLPLLHFFGRCLGSFFYYFVPIRKKCALDSLALSFPDMPLAEQKRIVHDLYRHLGALVMNHCYFPRIKRADLVQRVELVGLDVLRAAMAKGKGVVLTGAHMGDWEISSLALGAAGIPLSLVTAPIHNPYLDRMIKSHRHRLGVELIPSKGMSLRDILVELKKKNCVGLLVDQSAGRHGLLVDFFGRKASTPKGPAQFAVKTGAPLFLCSSTPKGDGSHRMVFEEIATEAEGLQGEELLFHITQDVTAKIEQYIRQNPQYWFGWFHRRWKIRAPKVKD